MERKTFFVDVILPLAVEGTFTYRVPYELNDEVGTGKRVVVQFGKKKIYTALIYKVHQNAPTAYSVKYVLSVLDKHPMVTESQFKLWEWMAYYYYSHLGEVMNAALPQAFKLESETRIILNPDFNQEFDKLNDKEYLVAEALTVRNVLSLTEVSKITEQIKVFNIVKSLIEKGVVVLEEELKDKYKPKIETFVKLSDIYKDETNLKKLFDNLEKKAEKQFNLLLKYIQLAQKQQDMFFPVSKNVLLKEGNFSASVLDGMIKKEIFEAFKSEVSRLKKYDKPLIDTLSLTESQELAYQDIKEKFKTKDVVLLHGVTSSGKTEIYAKLIDEVVKSGKQVLYLLPEIALTTQMISRLKKFFGDDIGVYHSKFSDNERVEIWHSVLNSNNDLSQSRKYKIILGARSALFLPYTNLGLIIVDEEHEVSYKQHYPSPYYNARDCAVFLGSMYKCKTLLGSATPAIETYYNSETGKYGRVNLFKRYNNLQLPEFFVVDLKDLYRKKAMKSFFSPFLLEQIEICLNNREQVILFQNRRGFALWMECQNCHHIPSCKNCDVTLTYHKKSNVLKCHYCGYAIEVPDKCPACSSNKTTLKSYGTERIEDELGIFFPKAKIARMDYDSTRAKNSFQEIINDFEENRVQILVGTQMVSKGMDFDNVGLVGVLNADNMLHFPDFRSYERAFQLVAQVSGRTGRKTKRGKVILQSFNPEHFIINCIIHNDYDAFYRQQIEDRLKFFYPPFCRLILISLKHRKLDTLNKAAAQLAENLRKQLPKRILGPEYPYVSKIKNEYIKNILVKAEKAITIKKIREILTVETDCIKKHNDYKGLKIIVDVDPV